MKASLPGMTARAVRCRSEDCKRKRRDESPYCDAHYIALMDRALRGKP